MINSFRKLKFDPNEASRVKHATNRIQREINELPNIVEAERKFSVKVDEIHSNFAKYYEQFVEIYCKALKPEEIQHSLEAAKFEMLLVKHERLKADREQQLADIAEQENEHRQRLNTLKAQLDTQQRCYKLRSENFSYFTFSLKFLTSQKNAIDKVLEQNSALTKRDITKKLTEFECTVAEQPRKVNGKIEARDLIAYNTAFAEEMVQINQRTEREMDELIAATTDVTAAMENEYERVRLIGIMESIRLVAYLCENFS